ncbi:hypothetical protein [Sulfurospirillum cavolei]|uniref:hypothetical protein n=1 Tax=Sulfurospirillum cavolei TaxID=366522 RepID=UPI0005A9F194|nr:hypothetical protein [Sulfurospirillum cavolei]
MYGITKEDRKMLLAKLKKQQEYLYDNFIDTGFSKIPYANFFQNAWHNSNRYIAELNHRVWSLNQYANDRGLVCIFAVLSLPSSYHRKRQITLKNNLVRLVRNDDFIEDEFHTVSAGSKRLREVVRSIFNSKAFRAIDRLDRCYVTTSEPHKDGTCHLNLMCFVPKNFVNACVKAIESRFIDEHSHINIAIDNPTAYIMKYIFKTLDDLRESDGDLDNLSDLTLWYIHHKIPRVTMSRTFVSLDIYRCLKGQFSLNRLSTLCSSGALDVIFDQNGKILSIIGEFGDVYSRKRSFIKNDFLKASKPCLKDHTKPLKVEVFDKDGILLNPVKKPVSHMKNYELLQYYFKLDPEECNLHHFGIVQNECVKRGLIEGTIQSLNDFNTDFDEMGA